VVRLTLLNVAEKVTYPLEMIAWTTQIAASGGARARPFMASKADAAGARLFTSARPA
jgi:hypothetical protein